MLLPGRGLEKLAGEGLCGRDSANVGEPSRARVKSVNPMTLCAELPDGATILPFEILLRSEAWRAGKSRSALECARSSFEEGSALVRVFFISRPEPPLSSTDLLSMALTNEEAGEPEQPSSIGY